MFNWDLNTPLFSIKNKKNKLYYMKNLKLYGPFLSMGFNISRAQSDYKERVHFLQLSLQEFLVLI